MSKKMKMPLFFAAFSLCFFALHPLLAEARPATISDLSGKKFCWNDGGTENYYEGGKYSSTHDGEGTWAITDKGVRILHQPNRRSGRHAKT